MGPIDLIDTTEMYLKTIYEMEEDGVVPMRARIVERLGHSGPTVSQTVARMERDGLVTVREDRRLELTSQGYDLACEVMRKHRLAECLLVSVIGMDWSSVHEEACRWEHVMSFEVEQRLNQLLDHPQTDPYGNPIPVPGVGRTFRVKQKRKPGEISLEEALAEAPAGTGTVTRIGEPVQADRLLLVQFADRGILPGTPVDFVIDGEDALICRSSENSENAATDGEPQVADEGSVRLSSHLLPHMLVTRK